MDMFRMFKTGMDIMGDADSALYNEPSPIAQVYHMMYAGADNIGLLPPRSRKTKKETGEVYPLPPKKTISAHIKIQSRILGKQIIFIKTFKQKMTIRQISVNFFKIKPSLIKPINHE